MTTELMRPPRRFHQICRRRRPYVDAAPCTGELYVVGILADKPILVCSYCDYPELAACARSEEDAA